MTRGVACDALALGSPKGRQLTSMPEETALALRSTSDTPDPVGRVSILENRQQPRRAWAPHKTETAEQT